MVVHLLCVSFTPWLMSVDHFMLLWLSTSILMFHIERAKHYHFYRLSCNFQDLCHFKPVHTAQCSFYLFIHTYKLAAKKSAPLEEHDSPKRCKEASGNVTWQSTLNGFVLTTSDSQWKRIVQEKWIQFMCSDERRWNVSCWFNGIQYIQHTPYTHISLCTDRKQCNTKFSTQCERWWATTGWYIFKPKLKWTTLWHLFQQLMTFAHLSLSHHRP